MRSQKPLDYSFMHLGGLYDELVNIAMEASCRFHSQKAMTVISIACHAGPTATAEAIRHEVYEETGITISDDDLLFLSSVASAHVTIAGVVAALRKEISNGR